MKTFTIERLRELQAEITEFNNQKLSHITLTENGIPVIISKDCLEEWRFIGLDNLSFVEFEYWKNWDNENK